MRGSWAAALALACGWTVTAAAQPAAKDNIYAWPDIGTGMWAPDIAARYGASGGNGGNKVPLNAAGQKEAAERSARRGGSGVCDPVGPLGMINAGYPLKFYFSPGEIVIMSDMDMLAVRHVYMDGRSHDGVDESYNGHSVGHWEGKTLVIDTVALSPKVNGPGGIASTPKTHLIERYTLDSPTAMTLQLTVEDPARLTAPWTLRQAYVRHNDWAIEDVYCGEGNRSAPDAEGNEKVDLTPPE